VPKYNAARQHGANTGVSLSSVAQLVPMLVPDGRADQIYSRRRRGGRHNQSQPGTLSGHGCRKSITGNVLCRLIDRAEMDAIWGQVYNKKAEQ
jgi:hypothetical protein